MIRSCFVLNLIFSLITAVINVTIAALFNVGHVILTQQQLLMLDMAHACTHTLSIVWMLLLVAVSNMVQLHSLKLCELEHRCGKIVEFRPFWPVSSLLCNIIDYSGLV